LGISFHYMPRSSIQRTASRLETPPPSSAKRRSSLPHSVAIRADNPSSQGRSRVIQPQLYSVALVVARGFLLAKVRRSTCRGFFPAGSLARDGQIRNIDPGPSHHTRVLGSFSSRTSRDSFPKARPNNLSGA
jgi:hypothetical protein